MSVDLSKSRTLYAITVVGEVNPALHHPQWYRSNGLIEQEEFDAAISSGLISMPFISQFAFGDPVIALSCMSGRWSVQSPSSSRWNRIVELTLGTFDKLALPNITAFGFNAFIHTDIDLPNVGASLASGLNRLELGLPDGPQAGSSITVADNGQELKTTYTIQPSMLDSKSVFVALNVQYEGALANFKEFLIKAANFPENSQKRIAEIANAVKKFGVK